MRITYDPGKRQRALNERGLDFEDAAVVFDGHTFKCRILCFGWLAGRLVVVGYTPRGEARHIFSMRKANAREQERLAPYLGLGPQAK